MVESPGLDVIFPRSVRGSHILLVAFIIGLSLFTSLEGDIVLYTHVVGTSDWIFGSPSKNPFLLHWCIRSQFSHSPTWEIYLLIYVLSPACLHKHPRSIPWVLILSLAKHSSSPPCKLSKFSVTGLASASFLLEAAWGEYLNSLFSKTVGITLRSNPK